MHSKAIESNITLENNGDLNSNFETYYYCGKHVDGCDREGPINVYHYISKTLLGDKKIKDDGNFDYYDYDYDYDLELWPGDKLWVKACTRQPITIEFNFEN